MGIEDPIKAYNDPPLGDMAIGLLCRHDFELKEWEHLSAYPLLDAKSAKHSVAEPPHFTSGESQEREQLVKLLYEGEKAEYTYALKEWVADGKGQPLEEPYLTDTANNKRKGLYLLARCGDESAFLELTQIDLIFPVNWFFQTSLMAWRRQAGLEKNERAMDILKKLREAIVSPYRLPKKVGRPRKVTPGVYSRYIAQKTSNFDKPNSDIYRNIAKENLKANEEEITPKTIETEAERIKKELQKPPLFFPTAHEMAKYMTTGETPKRNKNLEESRWNMAFRYLQEKIE